MGTEEPRGRNLVEPRAESPNIIMSTLNYAWNVRGTLNGDFMSASGTTASVDGIADVHGTAGEGAPFNHSTWIWGGLGHYGLAWFQGGHKENPTGSSRLGPSTPSPSPRVTTTSGTEAPSNSSSTTELTTAATGKWPSISERPSSPAKCQTHTSSNSGPRPGTPNLTTGTSTRGKRWNNLLMTKVTTVGEQSTYDKVAA